jgi:cytochrome c oxidase assembly protein subunit 11
MTPPKKSKKTERQRRQSKARLPPVKQPNRNTRILILLLAVAGLMGSIAYASVPLYTLFCKATGFGGTTQRASAAPAQTTPREITVSFDANVDPALPWDFAPETRSVKVRLGETATVKFRARNRGHTTITGMAVHNVQPDKAGLYFDKTQCFCFTKQVLKPGQSEDMPVQFYIDPAMADDHNEDDVTHITLSYTFYVAKR